MSYSVKVVKCYTLAYARVQMLTSCSLKLHGKDNASWLYLRQAVQLGQDIGLFNTPKSRHNDWDQMPERIRHASAQTAWSIFILNSYVAHAQEV